jgi:hypothetical protein
VRARAVQESRSLRVLTVQGLVVQVQCGLKSLDGKVLMEIAGRDVLVLFCSGSGARRLLSSPVGRTKESFIGNAVLTS